MPDRKSDNDTVTAALLDPVDRLSEVMFGLLMALTFTGTMSVTLGSGGTVNGILIAAIGCNIAWGIVDGVMYLLRTATTRRRAGAIIADIRHSVPAARPALVRELAGDDLTRGMTDGELGRISDWLIRSPATAAARPLRASDRKAAMAIFMLVVISTFPPITPFLLLDDVFAAMRWSNGIAVAMLLGIGWKLDKYIGHGSVMMRIVVPLVGTALVAATIALGG